MFLKNFFKLWNHCKVFSFLYLWGFFKKEFQGEFTFPYKLNENFVSFKKLYRFRMSHLKHIINFLKNVLKECRKLYENDFFPKYNWYINYCEFLRFVSDTGRHQSAQTDADRHMIDLWASSPTGAVAARNAVLKVPWDVNRKSGKEPMVLSVSSVPVSVWILNCIFRCLNSFKIFIISIWDLFLCNCVEI